MITFCLPSMSKPKKQDQRNNHHYKWNSVVWTFSLDYLYTTTVSSGSALSLSAETIWFSINKTENSTLPPSSMPLEIPDKRILQSLMNQQDLIFIFVLWGYRCQDSDSCFFTCKNISWCNNEYQSSQVIMWKGIGEKIHLPLSFTCGKVLIAPTIVMNHQGSYSSLSII